jgi:heme-degrading monooxygenase HmoA
LSAKLSTKFLRSQLRFEVLEVARNLRLSQAIKEQIQQTIERPGLAAATALLWLAAGVSDTTAANPDRVEARFEVYGFAGLHVLTNRTTVERSGDRYMIVTDLDTRGAASVFVNLTSHSYASGRLGSEAPYPETYRAEVRRNGVERHYAVDFRRDGTFINASAPASPAQAASEWPKEIRGAVDQLTAYFLVEKQLAVHRTCALVVPVFDGSAFYNLRSTDVKSETLSADDYQTFAGSSRVCEVVREDLALKPDRNEDTYQRGKIWYARLVDGEMTPVRMEFTTAFGVVKAYLAELHGRGIDLHLTRE